MRNLILLALFAAACGGAVEKTGGGDNNGSSNNGATNNGASNNAGNNSDGNNGANNTDSNNVIIVGNNSDNNAVNNTTPANNGVACETRADCSADQECVDGACADHRACYGFEGSSGGDGTCEFVWSCEEDDGKIYAINCEDDGTGVGALCTCVINDVAVDEFAADAETTCTTDSAHRAANEGCGFLLPQF